MNVDLISSVAARQMADDIMAQTAQVDPATALEWAVVNKVELPAVGRFAAINRARESFNLPPFVIVRAPHAHDPREIPVYKGSAADHVHHPPSSQVTPIMDKPVAQTEPTKERRSDQIVRTSAGLRDALFKEMEALRSGQSNPKQSLAVAKLASVIVDSVRVEIEFARHVPAGQEQEQMRQPLLLVRE